MRFSLTLPAFDAPVRRSPSDYCHKVWYTETLTWCGYLFGDMFTRFYQIHKRDRQTDGQTDTARQHRPRL